MSSRLHKIGTIYSRVDGLIRKGHIAENEKPIWFDVYACFPPKYEPTYGRPAPPTKIRSIFYEEDKVRAQLHKAYPHLLGTINLENDEETNSQKWLKLLKVYKKEGLSECQALVKLKETIKNEQS